MCGCEQRALRADEARCMRCDRIAPIDGTVKDDGGRVCWTCCLRFDLCHPSEIPLLQMPCPHCDAPTDLMTVGDNGGVCEGCAEDLCAEDEHEHQYAHAAGCL